MNLLTLKIDKDSSGSGFKLLLFIDKSLFSLVANDGAVVFDELRDSLRSQGDYLILTCSCGVADCGGWQKVNVSHHNGFINWAFEYDDKVYKFQFQKENYSREVEKVKRQISEEKIQLNPDFIVDPE